MFSTLTAVISFVVALGILITVHEFGHFWVARRCGVKVLRFSIGFGKRLYSWTDKHDTEFVIAAIPLGGYVKMLDSRVEEVEPDLYEQAFDHKTIGQRAAIISAGPIANFILAFLFYWLINMIGQTAERPVIGSVVPNSVVAQAGFTTGDELKSIAGIETKSWYDVSLALLDIDGLSQAEVESGPVGTDIRQTRYLDLQDWRVATHSSPIVSLGIVPYAGEFELFVTSVGANSAAERAALRDGDKILAMNGKPLESPMGFIWDIQSHPEKEMTLKIERSGTIQTIVLIPEKKQLEDGRIQGVAGFGLDLRVQPLDQKYMTIIQYGPIDAVYYASKQVWQITSLITKEIGRLVTGNRELSSLAGPITMAKGAGKSAENGLVSYLGFLAIISLNLAIINLFPLPVLDGGHLLFLAIEKVTGRPVSERVQDYCYRIGIFLLVMLMGLAFFNDFSAPQG